MSFSSRGIWVWDFSFSQISDSNLILRFLPFASLNLNDFEIEIFSFSQNKIKSVIEIFDSLKFQTQIWDWDLLISSNYKPTVEAKNWELRFYLLRSTNQLIFIQMSSNFNIKFAIEIFVLLKFQILIWDWDLLISSNYKRTIEVKNWNWDFNCCDKRIDWFLFKCQANREFFNECAKVGIKVFAIVNLQA